MQSISDSGRAPTPEFHTVTPERLADLERFSQAHGTFRYCSCMR